MGHVRLGGQVEIVAAMKNEHLQKIVCKELWEATPFAVFI